MHYGDTTLTFLNNLYRADQRGTALTYASAVAVEEKSVIDYNLGNPDGVLDPGEEPAPHGCRWSRSTRRRAPSSRTTRSSCSTRSGCPTLERKGAERFEESSSEPDNQQRVLEYGFRPGNPEGEVGSPITPENGVDPTEPQTLLRCPTRRAGGPARPLGRATQAGTRGCWSSTSQARWMILLTTTRERRSWTWRSRPRFGAIDQFGPRDVVGLRVFSTRLGPPGYRRTGGYRKSARRSAGRRRGTTSSPGGGPQRPQAEEPDSVVLGDATGVRGRPAAYEPDRINAVVLLSDGQNDDADDSDDPDQLEELLGTLEGAGEGEQSHPVRVFPIAYGADAELPKLEVLAEASDSAVYDAKDPSKIARCSLL